MTDTQQMFRSAIDANPYDPVLRLQYADWLEEQDREHQAFSLRELVRLNVPKPEAIVLGGGFGRLVPKTFWHVRRLDTPRRGRRILEQFTVPNAFTTQGLNHSNDVLVNAGTQVTQWYVLPVNNSGWSAFAAADTPSSHAGWTELTDYSESVRQSWHVDASNGGVSLTTSVITFTANATIAVKGGAIISVNTKSATTGTLLATAAFGSVQNLVSGQALQFTISLTSTSS